MLRLAGEGFVVGANLPWVNYIDFGANAWRPQGGLARDPWRAQAQAALTRLRGCGAQVVRWWILGDGRAGIAFDAHGVPEGPDPFFLDDLDAAFHMLEDLGLQVMPVLLDALWCHPPHHVDGVMIGGRSRALLGDEPQRMLLERVIAPILERYGRHPSVWAWDVINEPDLVTRGCWPAVPATAVAANPMRALIGEAVRLAHALAGQPVTVGLGNARHLPLVRGLGLDLYQVHWYDINEWMSPLETPVSAFGLDAPVILGEFPTRNSRRSPAAILGAARRAGYAGALAWSLLAADAFSDADACEAALAEAAAG
jgi:hypothetical protein